MTYLGFLSELVIAECDDRTRRRAERRIRDAGFPRPKRLEEFSFDANPAINPAVIGQLASCAWVKAGHPLCLIGDSGTGKSHLLGKMAGKFELYNDAKGKFRFRQTASNGEIIAVGEA